MKAPTPVVSGLSPATAPAGGSDFTLTVNGSSFTSHAVVTWNGTQLTTVVVSATQLTATVPAGLLGTPGLVSVAVTNEGQTNSNAVSFTVTGAGPVIVSLNPTFATAGGAAFTLTVKGSGFAAGFKVQWNSSALATTFQSDTQLTAAVPANLIVAAGLGEHYGVGERERFERGGIRDRGDDADDEYGGHFECGEQCAGDRSGRADFDLRRESGGRRGRGGGDPAGYDAGRHDGHGERHGDPAAVRERGAD